MVGHLDGLHWEGVFRFGSLFRLQTPSKQVGRCHNEIGFLLQKQTKVLSWAIWLGIGRMEIETVEIWTWTPHHGGPELWILGLKIHLLGGGLLLLAGSSSIPLFVFGGVHRRAGVGWRTRGVVWMEGLRGLGEDSIRLLQEILGGEDDWIGILLTFGGHSGLVVVGKESSFRTAFGRGGGRCACAVG